MPNSSPRSHQHETWMNLIDNVEFIETLRDGPKHKSTIADEIGVSPETVYRRARKLENLNLLNRSSEGYRLTNTGRLHAQVLTDVHAYSEQIFTCETIFEELTEEDLPRYPVLLNGEVSHGSPVAPNQQLEHVQEFVRTAERLKALLPVVPLQYVDALRDHVDSADPVDLLLCPNVTEYLMQEHPTLWSRMLDTERFTVRKSDDEVSFSLLIAERPSPSMCLVTYGEMNGLRGVLRNDTAVSVQWAQRRFQSYWESAVELPK